ncbi:MAG TPA: hypothetical protein VGZ27_15080 [Vicinamibacterales bacterium]|jgi:hypothetical protein|nr:hypothetical protein [Vicinamibacterales bacterium]
MQQRQLRLGDILDDYCPRERRLANHTVVAMVGDEVRLTRCTTCDTEHPYKGGKVPRQRKKNSVQAAYDEVLDSVKKDAETPGVLVTHTEPAETAVPSTPATIETPHEIAATAPPADDPAPDATPEETRMHRPLIRASLPRVETQPPPRPIPEFTIRQANRQGRFQNPRAARFAKTRGGPNNNSGNSHQGNSRGPGGPHGRPSGRPQGHGSPMRPGPGRHPGQHQGPPGKKRPR